MILPRHPIAELQDALTYSRVVNIVGTRQAGKTTLVRDLLQTGKFISLDDDAACGRLARRTDADADVVANDRRGNHVTRPVHDSRLGRVTWFVSGKQTR